MPEVEGYCATTALLLHELGGKTHQYFQTQRCCSRSNHFNGLRMAVTGHNLLTPPGEMDADIVVGTTQRLGMPMGAGGPHAAYLACRDEYKREIEDCSE